jgi:hypothetical protein
MAASAMTSGPPLMLTKGAASHGDCRHRDGYAIPP